MHYIVKQSDLNNIKSLAPVSKVDSFITSRKFVIRNGIKVEDKDRLTSTKTVLASMDLRPVANMNDYNHKLWLNSYDFTNVTKDELYAVIDNIVNVDSETVISKNFTPAQIARLYAVVLEYTNGFVLDNYSVVVGNTRHQYLSLDYFDDVDVYDSVETTELDNGDDAITLIKRLRNVGIFPAINDGVDVDVLSKSVYGYLSIPLSTNSRISLGGEIDNRTYDENNIPSVFGTRLRGFLSAPILKGVLSNIDGYINESSDINKLKGLRFFDFIKHAKSNRLKLNAIFAVINRDTRGYKNLTNLIDDEIENITHIVDTPQGAWALDTLMPSTKESASYTSHELYCVMFAIKLYGNRVIHELGKYTPTEIHDKVIKIIDTDTETLNENRDYIIDLLTNKYDVSKFEEIRKEFGDNVSGYNRKTIDDYLLSVRFTNVSTDVSISSYNITASQNLAEKADKRWMKIKDNVPVKVHTIGDVKYDGYKGEWKIVETINTPRGYMIGSLYGAVSCQALDDIAKRAAAYTVESPYGVLLEYINSNGETIAYSFGWYRIDDETNKPNMFVIDSIESGTRDHDETYKTIANLVYNLGLKLRDAGIDLYIGKNAGITKPIGKLLNLSSDKLKLRPIGWNGQYLDAKSQWKIILD